MAATNSPMLVCEKCLQTFLFPFPPPPSVPPKGAAEARCRGPSAAGQASNEESPQPPHSRRQPAGQASPAHTRGGQTAWPQPGGRRGRRRRKWWSWRPRGCTRGSPRGYPSARCWSRGRSSGWKAPSPERAREAAGTQGGKTQRTATAPAAQVGNPSFSFGSTRGKGGWGAA